jgi:tight adherence protein B
MTRVVVPGLLGALAGLGILIVILAWCGAKLLVRPVTHSAPGDSGRRAAHLDRLVLRAAAAAGAGTLMLVLTRWPVAAAGAAAGGWMAPSAIASAGRAQREIAKVEAIATWAEQLRDTLAAANGLESAISATASLAPAPIAAPVRRLGARIEYDRTTDALRRFATEVDHPVADFVVAALVVAAERQARDLAALLGHLAATARAEAGMRSRVWVGRARTRTSVRVIAAVVPLMVLAVMALDPHYFDPYDSASGQLVLLGVGGVFVASFALMERFGRIELPERFVARRDLGGQP